MSVEDRRRALLDRFRAAGSDRAKRLAAAVLQLETDPSNAETIAEAKREAHTLKGESKLLGLEVLNRALQHGEALLYRTVEEQFSRRELVDALLEGIELVRKLLVIDDDGAGASELAAFEARIAPLMQGPAEAPAPSETPTPAEAPAPTEARARPIATKAATEAEAWVRVPLSTLDDWSRLVNGVRRGYLGRVGERKHVAALLVEIDRLQESATLAAADDPVRTLKEMAAKLQELRHRLRALLPEVRARALEEEILGERLSGVLRSLQMVPLGELFEAYPAAVRELAAELGKRVELSLGGVDIAIDKRVMHAIEEPLLHLVRNAIDHGLESPEERRAADKDPTGRLELRATMSGALVEIMVRDDGRGIDPRWVRERAAARGFRAQAETSQMTDGEVTSLLFEAGFSTRDEVTEHSGRGVGLDVVAQRVAGLGGTVGVDSKPGRGSTFRLLVPVSVATVRMLVVEAAGARCALASYNVDSVVHVGDDSIERVGQGWVLRQGSAPIVIADLGELLGGTRSRPAVGSTGPAVVLRSGRRRAALWVDGVVGVFGLSVRPLDPLLREHPMFLGTGQLDDGHHALTMDVEALLRASVRVSGRGSTAPSRSTPGKTTILLVDDSEVARDLIHGLLVTAGYEVVEAVNGSDALERIESVSPDLVITDLQMPELDGFGLLGALREHERWRNLPIVVCSTLGETSDKMRASALGADAYIVKTNLDHDSLLEVVRRFVGATDP